MANKRENYNNNNANSENSRVKKIHSENKIYAVNGKKKDYFGYSVSIYESNLIVGAYSAGPFVSYSGAVYAFQQNYSESRNRTVWNQIGVLIGAEVQSFDNFGGTTSMWGSTALVGAYLDDSLGTSAGAAYIFELSHDKRWRQKQRLLASDGSSGDFFSYSVSINRNVSVLGAHGWATRGNLIGAAYIFEYHTSNHMWTETAKIIPTDSQEFQMFGYAVSVYESVVLVGAYGDRASGTNTGAGYIFFAHKYYSPAPAPTGNGTNAESDPVYIEETEWLQTSKLYAADPEPHSYFGMSVALDGIWLRTPNPLDATYIAIIGAYMAHGMEASSGAAYIFQSTARMVGDSVVHTWSQTAKLIAADGRMNDFFGGSLAIQNGVVLIGSKEDSSRHTGAGSAYFFAASRLDIPGQWSFQSKITANDSAAYDDFGVSVSFYGDVAIVGADRGYGAVEGSGCAYIYAPSRYSRAPHIGSTRVMVYQEHKFLLLLTVLPVALLSLPLLTCFCLWYVKYKVFRSGNGKGKDQLCMPLGQDSTHSMGNTGLSVDGSYHSGDVVGPGWARAGVGASGAGAGYLGGALPLSQHGLIVGQRELHEVRPCPCPCP